MEQWVADGGTRDPSAANAVYQLVLNLRLRRLERSYRTACVAASISPPGRRLGDSQPADGPAPASAPTGPPPVEVKNERPVDQ
eukprot:4807924-Alexandrium_andersonii.AAC.1